MIKLKILYTLFLSIFILLGSQAQSKIDTNKNLKILFDTPIKNFDSLKVAIKMMTSGVFNNKGRLIKNDSSLKVYVKYNVADKYNVIVNIKDYGTKPYKNEKIVSISQFDHIENGILNLDINFSDSRNKILKLLGKPKFVNDSLFIYHNNIDKVAFFTFENDKIALIQVSQFNINIAKTGLPKFKSDGGFLFPEVKSIKK
jgi:hypothetical protein